ncbi:MAG: hypothetical protein IH602_15040 [Bryobacteraceae bacterium]|nr:hypothetical protein [Bryobacteraceae bacterium]
MERKELTITRDGIEAVAYYTGRSVEVDLYCAGEHLNHISGQAEWQHYATVEEMLTAAAGAEIARHLEAA